MICSTGTKGWKYGVETMKLTANVWDITEVGSREALAKPNTHLALFEWLGPFKLLEPLGPFNLL